eukprot:5684409-Karenia_brevis.AAC.1
MSPEDATFAAKIHVFGRPHHQLTALHLGLVAKHHGTILKHDRSPQKRAISSIDLEPCLGRVPGQRFQGC